MSISGLRVGVDIHMALPDMLYAWCFLWVDTSKRSAKACASGMSQRNHREMLLEVFLVTWFNWDYM